MEFQFLHAGLNAPDYALALNRVAVGAFFAISGWHKLVVPQRHAAMVQTMTEDRIPWLRFNSWFVPGVELFAGLALLLGVYSVPAALLLGAICLVATCTDGVKRIIGWKPIDKLDCIDDVLYLPEVLLGLMLVITICAGPGALSLVR